MAVDTQQILDAADSLGKLVAQHPVVERYRQAQKSLSEDADAARLMNDFNRQIMTLARQEESGMPVTDAQRRQLEALQGQLASHLKVKAMNLAQVEFIDLLRRVSDQIRKPLSDGGQPAPAAGGASPSPAAPPGPKLVI
jgi:cell fate (sporulation/competence/biofilm development) regulator YlbF (YheA/YmcA/DUF963 family)